MAVRSGAGTGVIVSLVVFVLTTVFMLVLALVFYAGKSKAMDSEQAAKNTLTKYVRDQERNRDQFVRYEQAATGSGKSVAGFLGGQQADLMLLASGAPTTSIEELRSNSGLREGESLLQALENTRRSLRSSQAEIEGANKQLAARDEDLAELDARLESLRESHSEELASVTDQIARYVEEGERFGDDIKDTIDQLERAKDRLEDEYALQVADLEDELDRTSQDNSLLRDRLDQLESIVRNYQDRRLSPEALVDGRIIEVDALNDQVFIDRGRKHHITLGMTFEVYDDFSSIRLDDRAGLSRGKASIQVIKVGENTSTGKITRKVSGRPVVRNNVIANAIYDPEYTFKFMVHGKFDVDGDGRPTEAEAEYLRGLVLDWGGEVVIADELPGDLDFLVLGEMPPPPPPLSDNADPIQVQIWADQKRIRSEYENLFKQSREAQIPVLNANRFFILIGRGGR